MTYEEALINGLTPLQKMEIYKRVKAEIENNRNNRNNETPICPEILYPFDNWDSSTPTEDTSFLKKMFPEFVKHKPKKKRYGETWFDSDQERIEVLNKLIEEQKKLIST